MVITHVVSDHRVVVTGCGLGGFADGGPIGGSAGFDQRVAQMVWHGQTSAVVTALIASNAGERLVAAAPSRPLSTVDSTAKGIGGTSEN